MTEHLVNHPIFINSHSIAGFYAHDGEMDPALILKKALDSNKQCYLPILDTNKGKELIFCQIDKNTEYHANRYDILEPKVNSTSKLLSASQLDLILLPLLAADKQGNRLGRGAGYYDYTLRLKKANSKPFLMGIAYNFQYLDAIPCETHDIKIDALVTEKSLTLF